MYADKLSMAHSLEDACRIWIARWWNTRNGSRPRSRCGARAQMAAPPGVQKISAAANLARKKRGFAVNVVDDWFNNSATGKITDMLNDEKSLMYAVLQPEPVKKLLAEHQSADKTITSCCSVW